MRVVVALLLIFAVFAAPHASGCTPAQREVSPPYVTDDPADGVLLEVRAPGVVDTNVGGQRVRFHLGDGAWYVAGAYRHHVPARYEYVPGACDSWNQQYGGGGGTPTGSATPPSPMDHYDHGPRHQQRGALGSHMVDLRYAAPEYDRDTHASIHRLEAIEVLDNGTLLAAVSAGPGEGLQNVASFRVFSPVPSRVVVSPPTGEVYWLTEGDITHLEASLPDPDAPVQYTPLEDGGVLMVGEGVLTHVLTADGAAPLATGGTLLRYASADGVRLLQREDRVERYAVREGASPPAWSLREVWPRDATDMLWNEVDQGAVRVVVTGHHLFVLRPDFEALPLGTAENRTSITGPGGAFLLRQNPDEYWYVDDAREEVVTFQGPGPDLAPWPHEPLEGDIAVPPTPTVSATADPCLEAPDTTEAGDCTGVSEETQVESPGPSLLALAALVAAAAHVVRRTPRVGS